MLTLALTIIHNKTPAENEQQIAALLPLIATITTQQPVFDETGTQIGTVDVFHYELKNLGIAHELRCYQVIPFGVTPPPNLYELDSHKVFYGKGDEDKTGEHPRFFNWGLKRGTDQGADVSVYLSDPVALSATKLRNAANKLINDTELVDVAWGKLATVRLLRAVGQLKEDRGFSQAINDYKSRIVAGGLKHG